jgi:acyl-coenzyme A thioesterase PaaI-like protein
MTHFYAVLSTLRAGAGCTTAELAMTFLGQPPCAGGEITTRSEVVDADERNALAVGMTYDDEGRPLAHSTSRYFLFPPERRRASVPQPCRSPKGRHKTPDPISRPCKPMSLHDEQTLERVGGLEILQAQLAGERPCPPIDRPTGIRLIDASDGSVVFSMPAHGWLVQEIGTVTGRRRQGRRRRGGIAAAVSRSPIPR